MMLDENPQRITFSIIEAKRWERKCIAGFAAAGASSDQRQSIAGFQAQPAQAYCSWDAMTTKK